jgi:excisionase family DNA binding protein
MERLSVSEAAERLGISKEAVRKRVQRGTLPHGKKPDGKVYVYLGSSAEAVSPTSEMESDNQAMLHYIDKLYSLLQAYSSDAQRSSLALVGLSLLLLALSGGAVSTQEQLTISGIGLRIPFAVFLTAGAVSLTFLITAYFTSLWQVALVQREIERLYESIGFDDVTSDSIIKPLEMSGVMWTLSLTFATTREHTSGNGTRDPDGSNVNPRGLWIIWAILYSLIPAAAQAGAGVKVSELLQEQGLGWVGLLFVLLVVVTSLAFSWGAFRMQTPPPESRAEIVVVTIFYMIVSAVGVGLGSFVAKGLNFL